MVYPDYILETLSANLVGHTGFVFLFFLWSDTDFLFLNLSVLQYWWRFPATASHCCHVVVNWKSVLWFICSLRRTLILFSRFFEGGRIWVTVTVVTVSNCPCRTVCMFGSLTFYFAGAAAQCLFSSMVVGSHVFCFFLLCNFVHS